MISCYILFKYSSKTSFLMLLSSPCQYRHHVLERMHSHALFMLKQVIFLLILSKTVFEDISTPMISLTVDAKNHQQPLFYRLRYRDKMNFRMMESSLTFGLLNGVINHHFEKCPFVLKTLIIEQEFADRDWVWSLFTLQGRYRVNPFKTVTLYGNIILLICCFKFNNYVLFNFK